MSSGTGSGVSAVTPEHFEDGLRRLGLGEGSLVVVHSSLRSFGHLEGGEDAFIDTLLRTVGPQGTVCMPTLTYGRYGPRRPPPQFDADSTSCIVGRIPERFRARPGVRRSLHPTHSVAAAGRLADLLVEGHEFSETPCGPGSPWGRLAAFRGDVLLAGVGTAVCTLFHGPEEEIEPDARCTAPTPCRLVRGGVEETQLLRLHRSYRGAVSNRAALAGPLEAAGLLRRTVVGDAELLLVEAAGLWEFSVALLRRRPSGRRDRASALARAAARRALRR
jgi:aminoglycoside 3-N-acetyltransferase